MKLWIVRESSPCWLGVSSWFVPFMLTQWDSKELGPVKLPSDSTQSVEKKELSFSDATELFNEMLGYMEGKNVHQQNMYFACLGRHSREKSEMLQAGVCWNRLDYHCLWFSIAGRLMVSSPRILSGMIEANHPLTSFRTDVIIKDPW